MWYPLGKGTLVMDQEGPQRPGSKPFGGGLMDPREPGTPAPAATSEAPLPFPGRGTARQQGEAEYEPIRRWEVPGLLLGGWFTQVDHSPAVRPGSSIRKNAIGKSLVSLPAGRCTGAPPGRQWSPLLPGSARPERGSLITWGFSGLSFSLLRGVGVPGVLC